MDSPDGNSRSTKYGVSSEKEYRWLRMSDLQLFLDHGKFRKISCYCHAEIEVMTEYCIFFPAPYELFYGALFF